MVFSPLLFYKNKSIVKGEDGGMYEYFSTQSNSELVCKHNSW